MSGKPTFVHSHAVVDEGASIGAGTRIWAFAHIVKGAVIGEECNICDHTFVEGGVRLYDRVTVKCGVYLWSGLTAESEVFIGPCVAFTNDLRPRSKRYPEAYSPVLLRTGCSLGANSTILPVTIGRWAMVGAGAVVTRDVPDYALVIGNPGRIRGWVCRCTDKLEFSPTEEAECACGSKFRRISPSAVQEVLP